MESASDLLRAEFQRLANLAHQATNEIPDPGLSCRIDGIWEMRNRHGAMLAEISSDGTVLEKSFDIDTGLLERIEDLRSLGFSSRRIMEWFGASIVKDEARDAQEVLMIALRCPFCK